MVRADGAVVAQQGQKAAPDYLMAQQRQFWALYTLTSLAEVLLATPQTRTPGGLKGDSGPSWAA